MTRHPSAFDFSAMNVEPLTPDHSHAPPSFRRSVTLPYRLIESPRTSPSSHDASRQSAETLYAHNAGKIVSFNPPLTGTRRHSSVDQGHSAVPNEPVGTLPWACITERTIAAGSNASSVDQISFSLTLIDRLFEHPQSSRDSLSQLRQSIRKTHPIEIAVLVCRWRIQVRLARRTQHVLPYRITKYYRRRSRQDRGVQGHIV